MRKGMFFVFIVVVVAFVANSLFAIEREACQSIARHWLYEMRNNPTVYEQGIWNIQDSLKKGCILLEELGTSEKELKDIKELGCKINAQGLIQAFWRRQNQEDENVCFLLLMEEMESCRLHLDQLIPDSQKFNRFRDMIVKRKLVERNTQGKPDQAREWRQWLLIYPNLGK